MSKPRTDSKLAHAPEACQHALSTWLRSGVHPIDCVKQLKEKFGVSSSSSAVYRFYRDYVEPDVRRQRAMAVQMADSIGAVMEKESTAWDALLIQQIQQKTFELNINPNADPSDIASLMTLLLKWKQLQLKESDLKLAERRVAALEAKMAQAQSKLSELRDPQKGDDSKMRQTILDEVDKLMGLKK